MKEAKKGTWGGKREGSGRKPSLPGAPYEPHRARAPHQAAHPVHLLLHGQRGMPSLRDRAVFAALCEVVRGGNHSPAVGDSFRIIEFSVQSDHVHLIVEARDADTLSRGIRGLTIRAARAVNRVRGKKGHVWRDRYKPRALKTPRDVRNAFVDVLMNARNHGVRMPSGIDPYSSAPWFRGFASAHEAPEEPSPVATPRTRLAATDWRRHGLIRFDEQPLEAD